MHCYHLLKFVCLYKSINLVKPYFSDEEDINCMCDGCKGNLLVNESVADSTHYELMELDNRPGEQETPQDTTNISFSIDTPSYEVP